MFPKTTFRMRMRQFAGDARHRLQRALGGVSKLVGRRLLSRPETEEVLSNLGQWPGAGALGRIKATGQRLEILNGGVVRLGNDCLDLDYGSRTALAGWMGRHRSVSRCAAVWSHYWMGYYHWIVDVLPKICLLQDQFGPDLEDLAICYPFWGGACEREAMDLLGVPKRRLIDSRGISSLRAEETWFCALPGWTQIAPGASRLREVLLPAATPGVGERIYISRTGRRCCLNEAEVFDALRRKGFVFVEDRPRSLREQMGIFREARFVVAPHGAALANLLWCEPGAIVLEFFGAAYQPDFYKALAGFGKLRYSRMVPPGHGNQHWTAMGDNVAVDVPRLMKEIDRLESMS